MRFFMDGCQVMRLAPSCNWTGAGDDIDDTAVPTNGGTDATIFNWVWGAMECRVAANASTIKG
jgi:hypothetical protein